MESAATEDTAPSGNSLAGEAFAPQQAANAPHNATVNLPVRSKSARCAYR